MSEQIPNPFVTTTLDPAALLRRLLFGWDEQWFLKAVARYGYDAAAEMDRQVRRDFGKMEMRAVLAQMGKPRAADLADAVAIADLYARTLYGTPNNLRFAATQPGHTEVQIASCPSFEVEKRKRPAERPAERGTIPGCDACAATLQAWFETLLPDWQIEVERRPPQTGLHTRFAVACLAPDAATVLRAAPPAIAPRPIPDSLPSPYAPLTSAETFAPTAVPAPLAITPSRRVLFHKETGPLPSPQPPAPLTVDGEAHELPLDDAETRRREAQFRARMGAVGRDEVSTPLVEQLSNDVGRRPTNFLSKMFFNKEARDLLERTEGAPIVVPMSMAQGIERILQDLLLEDKTLTTDAHVREGPEGDLEFIVGKESYPSIGAVPSGPLKAKFQQAVQLWQAMVK